MDSTRWDRIEQLTYEALSLQGEDRESLLVSRCGDDVELLAEIRSLIVELESESAFLSKPLIDVRNLEIDEELVEEDRRAGDYRLVRLLGRGGMGEVFLGHATNEGMPSPAAVKVIRRGMDSEDVLTRFRAEQRILSELHHANIAQLFRGGMMDDGRPFFVMEYVRGEPIDAYCDGRTMSVRDRLWLFLEVCAAIQHAHQNLIVHRDLKPGNVLVDEQGVPKLLDFGIAKVLGPATDIGITPLTKTGMRVLTPEFAAPEQLAGRPVSVATDCYGLGVLLHILLTGSAPKRRGESVEDTETTLVDREWVRPSRLIAEVGGADVAANRGTDVGTLRRKVAGDLDTIVLKALQTEPSRRYASAQALADDIARHLSGHPVLARPDGMGYRVGKFLRRNSWAAVAGGVAAAAVVGFVVQGELQSRALAEERDRAVEVRDFLLEAFGASGADQGTADTISARQLLDRRAQDLDLSYGDQPRLRAEMLGVLAEGYERLGIFDRARELAEQSLTARLDEYGADHVEVTAARSQLGWIRFQQGELAEADSILAIAVEGWRSLGQAGLEGLGRALNDRGVVVDRRGDAEQAEALLQESLTLRTELFGEGQRSVAVTASNLAASHYRQGEYAEATAVGEQALASLRESYGPDHQRSFVAQSNLAIYRWVAGDREGAEVEYANLLDRQRRVLGDSHPVTLRTRQALATFYERTGRENDAIAELTEILEARERSLGPDHHDVAESLEVLSDAYREAGEIEPALDLAQRSLEIKRDVYGDDHEEVAESHTQLGDIYRLARDLEAAELHMRTAADVITRSVGPDHPRAADVYLRYGSLLYELEDHDAALTEYARTARAAATSPPTSVPLNAARLQIARILLARGEVDRADSLVQLSERAVADVDGRYSYEDLMERVRGLVDSTRIAGGA